MEKTNKKFYADAKNVIGHYKIANPDETISELVSKNKSIARFGDGEIDFIYGKGMNYQKYDKKLANRLQEVLNSNEENLLIGIPDAVNVEYLKLYTGPAIAFWPDWINKSKFRLVKILDRNKQYYSTQITRFYIDYKDKSHTAQYVDRLKKLWDNKNIVIVEGDKSRLGIGNDLLDNVKSIQRIICPAENAFDKYDEILKEALKVSQDKLILLALGPTATVLSYDLYKKGYRAIDIGHVDIEYEWFLRKVNQKVKIETKYVTEVSNGRVNIDNIKDEKYEEQIITRIV